MNRNPGYERSDADTRAVWIFGACLIVCVALVCLAIGGMMKWLESGADRTAGPAAEPPPPRLQVSTREDMDKYRAAEMEHLNTYGWIDRDTGIIRIPVEHAMELVAERGLPPTEERLTPIEMRQQKASTP